MKQGYLRNGLICLLTVCMLAVLISCGVGDGGGAAAGGGTTDGTTDGTGSTSGTTQTAAKIVLTPSPFSVKSGGGDTGTSTITATVIDSYRVRVANMKVYFKTDSGELSAPFAVTGTNGEDAQVSFSSGSNSLNGHAKITAYTDSGVSEWTTVVIYGTTLTKSTDLTNPTNDGTSAAKAKLTITANDARGNPIRDVPIMFSSISSAIGGGTVAIYDNDTNGSTLTDNTKNTDIYGQATVTVEGKTTGPVTVKAAVKTQPDSVAPETSVTQDYTVIAPASVIAIEDPTADTYNMDTTASVTVLVKASESTTIRFAASRGYFDDDPTKLTTVKNVVANYASAKFSCTVAGFATVEVSDPNNPSGKDVLNVIVSAPLGAAPKIKLESSSANLPPSTGGVVNTVKLTATVTTASDERVANVPVAFSIVARSTGGMEKISPLIAVTDGTGRAETTFTSGDLGSVGQGVTVQASLADVVNYPNTKATASIFITGTPGSVAIGRGTLVADGNAYYRWPIVVIVADSEGHAVPNRTVSIKVWPSRYATGTWSYTENITTGAKMWGAIRTSINPNTDTDKDTIRDPGEAVNSDGQLIPPNSAAGVIPTTVMTDLEGKAIFDLIYAKEYAEWIEDSLTATIEVGGTETTSTVFFWLLPTQEDIEKGLVFNSPFGD